MRRFLLFLIIFGFWHPLADLLAGSFSCSATCLSKVASAVSIAANGKTIIAGTKKVGKKIGVVKSTKSTKGGAHGST